MEIGTVKKCLGHFGMENSFNVDIAAGFRRLKKVSLQSIRGFMVFEERFELIDNNDKIEREMINLVKYDNVKRIFLEGALWMLKITPTGDHTKRYRLSELYRHMKLENP